MYLNCALSGKTLFMVKIMIISQIYLFWSYSKCQIIKVLLAWWPCRLECRIQWLHICRGVRPHQHVSRIWHKKIWWWGSSNAGALGIRITPSVLSFLSSLYPDVVVSHLNCLFMLNRMFRNRTVWSFNTEEVKSVYLCKTESYEIVEIELCVNKC